MLKLGALSVLAATLSFAAVSEAAAWTRKAAVTGSAGRTVTTHASGGCQGGTCSRSLTRTGPAGYSTSRSGSASCNASTQSCSFSGSRTGVNGHVVTRSGSIWR